MNWFILIGIVIIVLGFSLKLDTMAVLIVAALSTALVAGIHWQEALILLGENFVKNRLVTIFLIPIPMIAMVERFGLRQQAQHLIIKLKGLTAPILLYTYVVIREVSLAFQIPLGGHVQFIRPLIYPMTEAAVREKCGEDLSDEEVDAIKGKCAAVENIANFYSQNIFVGSSGVLLIISTLTEAGYDVAATDVANTALTVGIASLIVVALYMAYWQQGLNRKGRK
jgi:hypothetical protein